MALLSLWLRLCNLDDEIEDIKPYFSESVIVKTSYKTGLTKEDVKKAIQILNKN